MQKHVSPVPPMRHQLEAQQRAANRRGGPSPLNVFALRMETGCGKSKVPIDEWQAGFPSMYDCLIVIAPAGSYRNWFADKMEGDEIIQLSELRTHLDPALYKRALIAPWVSGAEARRRREMLITTDRPKITVVNVEAFSSDGGKAERFVLDLLASCRQVRNADGREVAAAMLVVDESTTIRNDSKRTGRIMKLRDKVLARRILTGLATPKSPMDLYRQYEFLDPRILGYDSHVAFRARYAEVRRECFQPQQLIRAKLRQCMGLSDRGEARSHVTDDWLRRRLKMVYQGKRAIDDGMSRARIVEHLNVAADGMPRDEAVEAILRLGGWIPNTLKITGFKNLEELTEKLAPYSHVVLKTEALPELKPKIYEFWEHELTDKQQRAYDEMRKFATTELAQGHVSASNVVSRMMRLHQIVCGHARLETGEVVDLKSRRPDEIAELLSDHQGKAIIWSMYPRECEKIAARLREEHGPASVALFHGENRATRAEDERRFLGRRECRFMCSTQMSGGRGNTWNVADLSIYAGNSYDLEWRFQSEDRNHRKGQKNSVKYVDMIVRGTVEEKIVSALRRKIDLMSVINGENYRDWLV